MGFWLHLGLSSMMGRWVSARRGLTVLGKVIVPKPVNLPSQKLENHGLDPNVEIVPKGTLSWGSRSSSSQNPWGSVALSPSSTDGGPGSPSYLNDQPSSGGHGTRPSTAGSERSQERGPTVWGPSSRPSSASGVLASSQASPAAGRPHSADTRPGSSQLSRFAESVSENSVAWSASGTLEKLQGASSSKRDGFSLSSGDFPTLGSEKNTEMHTRQGHSSQGRPVSASSRASTPKGGPETSAAEVESIDASKEEGAENTSKKDNHSDVGNGVPPSTDNWQRENQPCPDPNMPHHFGPWRGNVPYSSHNGFWYGGPPGGAPYGPPGSYPIEPFYYRPRMPGRPIGNLQPLPRPGSGPSAYYPNNGDSYRPHMPDSYVHPVMPVASGVYPVRIPYDGYYGPPQVGFGSSAERDAPIMEMHPGPGVYNRYPIQNVRPDPGNLHGPGGYDQTSKTIVKEKGGSGHPHGPHQGPYRVLLKQHDGSDEIDSKGKREHCVNPPRTPKREHTIKPNLGKGNSPGVLTKESDPGENRRSDEHVELSRAASKGEVSSLPANIQGGHSSVSVVLTQRGDENLMKKVETAVAPGEAPHQLGSTNRNHTLIEKIESLNSKTRIFDKRYDVGRVSSRDDKKKYSVSSPRSDHTPCEGGSGAIANLEVTASARDMSPGVSASEGTSVSGPVRESQASTGILSSGGGGGYTNKRPHGVQGRADYRGKGKFNREDEEEWRKKPTIADVSIVFPLKKVESCMDDYVVDHHAAQNLSENSNFNTQGKAGDELHATTAFDPGDHKLQRAKMKEIAAERAKQLQKEEEERTRVQKARALAKLEDLNRRTKAESSTEKLDHAKHEELQFDSGPTADVNISSSVPTTSPGTVTHSSSNNVFAHGESMDPPNKVHIEAPSYASQDPIHPQNMSSPVPQGVNASEITDKKTTEFCGTSVYKPKQVGYKRKQNPNKNPNDQSIPSGIVKDKKRHESVLSDLSASGESNLPTDTNVTNEPLMQQKKKNNKGGKNKIKFGDFSSMIVEENSTIACVEIIMPNTPQPVSNVGLDQSLSLRENADAQDSQAVVSSTNKGEALQTEAIGGVNNQSKPQVPRRTQKSAQASRPKEKFQGNDAVVWAPVRSLSKNEAVDETSHNTGIESHALGVTGHGTHNNQKKRAEMERYVPKPVAKELSHQGNTQQQSSPSVNQVLSNETTGRVETNKHSLMPVAKALSQQGNAQRLSLPSVDRSVSDESIGRVEIERYVPKPGAKELSQQRIRQELQQPAVNRAVTDDMTVRAESSVITEPDGSAMGKGGLTFVPKTGDNKHYKHGKTHGLWRQINSVKSLVQPSVEGSRHSSDQSETVPKPTGQHHAPKPQIYLPKDKARDPDNLNAPSSSISTELVVSPVVSKDHGVTGRGRKQPFKGHKAVGHSYNLDHKDLHVDVAVEVGNQGSSQESANQSDGRTTVADNHVDPLMSSHWQPKSQPYASHNRQRSRTNAGQRGASQVGKAPRNEYHPQGENSPNRDGEEVAPVNKPNRASVVQPHHDESSAQKTIVVGVSNTRNHEAKREKKRVESPKDGPHFPDQHLDDNTNSVLPQKSNNLQEQSSSGFQRHGHNSGRVVRGHETQRSRSSGRQGNSKQRYPASSDGWNHDSHYEYQPARSYNKEATALSEEGSCDKGSKYHERGQTHSRRGGEKFYAAEQ